MDKPTSSPPRDRAGLLADFIREVQLWWRLMRDSRVPLWTKLIPLLALAYIVFPFDLIPDPLLGLGQLDDLAILILGMELFVSLSPADVVAELRRQVQQGKRAGKAAPAGPTVDAEYRVIDEGPGGAGRGTGAASR